MGPASHVRATRVTLETQDRSGHVDSRTSTCERQSYETRHRAGLQSVMILYSVIEQDSVAEKCIASSR